MTALYIFNRSLADSSPYLSVFHPVLCVVVMFLCYSSKCCFMCCYVFELFI